MYIKSIVIDGFKSYGRRTEVNGFDKEFNAITGLNGTGKSNILDSICFVLGISNLSHVRANSLQDLVYKSGQAGVTKATVTINFDNSNKNQCPIGYENCKEISVARQIVVGGKGKYMINGKNAQYKQIQDFFCSVQLNVNNPNFLIMQGRITKVLNMKPPEILSMIEEAAGTSMYESKREKSMSLIQKKDAKLDELNSLIRDDIQPKLDKLRKDQQQYIEYQKVCRDVENLTRIHISYKYLQCRKNIENCENTIQNLTDAIENNKATIEKDHEEIKEIEVKVQEIQEALDNQSGGDLKELEKELEGLNQQDAKLKATINATQEEMKSEQRKLKTLEKNIKIDETALEKKENEMAQMGGTFEELKQGEANDLKAFQVAQKRLEAVNMGLAINDDGEATSLQDQLTNANSKIADAKSTIKKSEMELKYSKQTLQKREKEVKTNDTAYIRDQEVINNTDKEIKNLENQLKKITYQDGEIEALMEKKDELTRECRAMRQNIDRQNGSKFDFQYNDPIPNWDKRRVKGLVANCIRVKDQKYSRALSSMIGGSWRNVITDNDETGKLLLERGNLVNRVTIIPLNKITARTIDNHTVNLAQKLVGKENAIPAIDLIEYDKEVEPAMKYLFGSAFICKDMESAKKVTYHRDISRQCYTLDGDEMSPSGALSGGAVAVGPPILEEVTRVNNMKNELNTKLREIQEITKKIDSLQSIAMQYRNVKEKLETFQIQMRAAKERIQSTAFQQDQDEINELKTKIETLTKTIEECQNTLVTNEAKVKDLTSKLADSKGHRERELKNAETELKKAKQKHEQSQKNWKKREQQYETMKLEIEELKKTIAESKEQVIQMEKNIEEFQKKIDETSNSDGDLKKRTEELKAQIKAQKDEISAQNKEIRTKTHRKEKLLKQIQELELDIKKKENEIVKVRADNTDGYNKIAALEEKYPWIPEDKDHFGARNTRYDYSKEDPQQAGQKLQKLQENKEKLSRNINQEAMMLLEKEEEHYKKIMDRRSKVEDDKKKILDSIKNMDTKKVENLKKAWEVVNHNFGSIFTTLLPGAQAKLDPPEGQNFLKGLEVKVGFNGIWKESLTELSGGQRSLVALSLILAMLKYKPAPLYILDEVDAALDLSHTQNIGGMLKAHFKNSQFVIVSLKDGMFNNANVLFRTKFVDGVSGVMRTVNKS
ncbi:structural maintenance of chromosomes protein 2 [Chironomus tepperi]|uniref:structural maintenance of chromosomes protein 2 n=1 Tax=Chironomus tepperi TaxID=113505 RepID=UPI00391EE862